MWQAARLRRWLRTCSQVGENPHIVGRPWIDGVKGQLRIGHRFRLASTPIGSHISLGPGAIVDIGDDVAIGCGAAIAALQQVSIGDGTRIGPFVIIMDTNFHSRPGDQSVQHDCLPITIGKGCRIGSRVTITRGATIGDGAEILAGSVVTSAIPPGVCAAGVRARIIGTANDPASRWESPAAGLPEILMESLDLRSPPDISNSEVAAHVWTDLGVQRLLEAISERFGVALNSAAVGQVRSYADIAGLLRRELLALEPRRWK